MDIENIKTESAAYRRLIKHLQRNRCSKYRRNGLAFL